MTLFHHYAGTDSHYISRFQIRQGDRSAGLSWEMRDGQRRDVLVYQSMQSFVDDDHDPTGDYRQRLVYQGSDLHARLNDAGPSDDVAYYYPGDVAEERGLLGAPALRGRREAVGDRRCPPWGFPDKQPRLVGGHK